MRIQRPCIWLGNLQKSIFWDPFFKRNSGLLSPCQKEAVQQVSCREPGGRLLMLEDIVRAVKNLLTPQMLQVRAMLAAQQMVQGMIATYLIGRSPDLLCTA